MCANPKQKIYYWFIIFSQFVQICKIIPITCSLDYINWRCPLPSRWFTLYSESFPFLKGSVCGIIGVSLNLHFSTWQDFTEYVPDMMPIQTVWGWIKQGIEKQKYRMPFFQLSIHSTASHSLWHREVESSFLPWRNWV